MQNFRYAFIQEANRKQVSDSQSHVSVVYVIVLQLPLLCRGSGVMHNSPILHLYLGFELIELQRLWPCPDLVDENDEVPILYQTLSFYPYVGVHLLSGYAIPLEKFIGVVNFDSAVVEFAPCLYTDLLELELHGGIDLASVGSGVEKLADAPTDLELMLAGSRCSWGLTIPPNTNRKRFKNRLRDLSEEEEITRAEREEDEEEIAFGLAFGVVIGWCLGQRFGWRWGWNWGCVWVVERNRGVLTVGLGLPLRVWDLLTVDHLYDGLKRKGISTFRDDEKLERGTPIGPGLFKAIEESRFAVVILSSDYASLRWCLIELAKIVDCMKKTRLIVLPVFHYVDPSGVRNQGEIYAEAFKKHEELFKDSNKEDVHMWKAALTEVASIAGWDLRDRRESKVIQEIVGTISSELNRRFSKTISKNLVGIDSRVEEMLDYYLCEGLGVRFVGICETAKRLRIPEEYSTVKKRLRQLKGKRQKNRRNRGWARPSQGLNDDEALELFSWRVFKKRYPKEGYVELSKDFVNYAFGIPLAITVLGSFLMNVLLQFMGQEIVRRESPKEPGKRCRLWRYEDVFHVLENDTGTESIEGIVQKAHVHKKERLNVESLSKMKKLRLLEIQDVLLPNHLNYLSNELHIIEWHGCPLNSMPANFQPNKLVELKMHCSAIIQLWKGIVHIDATDCASLETLSVRPEDDFQLTPCLFNCVNENQGYDNILTTKHCRDIMSLMTRDSVNHAGYMVSTFLEVKF
uniref:TIR domain-containing protein n=1 Tax=Quercus lobata TaxID=97700 RepID=A0A7N2MJ04_QUELO